MCFKYICNKPEAFENRRPPPRR